MAIPLWDTPSYRGAGTLTSGTGDITPPWPSATREGDIGILQIETRNETAITLSTPAGFELIGQAASTAGTDAQDTVCTLYWCRAASDSPTAPTIQDPGDHCIARIVAIRGARQLETPIHATATKVVATGTNNAGSSLPGVTTTVQNCLILQCFTFPSTNAGQFGSYVNANLVDLAERYETGAAVGASDGTQGGSPVLVTGEKQSSGATGDTELAKANTWAMACVTVAIEPPRDVDIAGDEIAPTVELISPLDGQLFRTTSIVVDVADELGISLAVVLAWFGDGTTEVVHTGDRFGEHYRDIVNARESLDGGLRYRYTLLRDGGWHRAPRFELLVRDEGGNAAVVTVGVGG